MATTTAPPAFHMVLGPVVRGKSPYSSPGADHTVVTAALVRATAGHITMGGPCVAIIIDST